MTDFFFPPGPASAESQFLFLLSSPARFPEEEGEWRRGKPIVEQVQPEMREFCCKSSSVREAHFSLTKREPRAARMPFSQFLRRTHSRPPKPISSSSAFLLFISCMAIPPRNETKKKRDWIYENEGKKRPANGNINSFFFRVHFMLQENMLLVASASRLNARRWWCFYHARDHVRVLLSIPGTVRSSSYLQSTRHWQFSARFADFARSLFFLWCESWILN